MSTPKHTPGPIHNGRPCTCCILLRTGEPLESVHGDQPCSDISRIELCPKHAAAPAMYEALKTIVGQQTPNRWGYDAAEIALSDEWRAQARAALAQAEGK